MRGLKIIHEPSLAERTSLGLGGKAVAEILLREMSGLEHLPGLLKTLGGEPRSLGRGSNILALDRPDGARHEARPGRLLPLTLVKVDFKDEPSLVPEPVEVDGEPAILARSGASCKLPALLSKLAAWGLSGLEGLGGIPGDVGGAVAMNAGSYGCEIADCLHEVTVFTLSEGLRTLKRGDFTCSYRSFKPTAFDAAAKTRQSGELDEWFIIIDAVFALRPSDPALISRTMKDNIQRKKATQPLQARSAGCLFKNPASGLSAGKLLDEAGFKGRRCGGMAFSELHANFLVNEGGAGWAGGAGGRERGTSAQAFELIHDAQNTVLERYGVRLEMEVKVWP